MQFEFDKNEEVESLDKVPSDLQPFYAQDGGKYKLQKSNPAVQSAIKIITGQGNALRAARTEADTYKKQVVDLSPLREFGDSPEAVLQAFNARISEVSKTANNSEVERIRADMQKAHAKEVEKVKNAAEAYKRQLHNTIVNGEALKAIAEQKGVPEFLMPHVQQRVVAEEDSSGKLTPYVVDDEGKKRYSTQTQGYMTIRELVSEMKADPKYARVFDSDTPTGSGAPAMKRSSGASTAMPESSIALISKGLNKLERH